MKIYSASEGSYEYENVLSLHQSREGAIAAVRSWIDEQKGRRFPEWEHPPDSWDGKEWTRGAFDYVQVEECEVLP